MKLSETIAQILDALGKHENAATVRWMAKTTDELIDENEELSYAVANAATQMENLESLLCKRCAAKWEKDK